MHNPLVVGRREGLAENLDFSSVASICRGGNRLNFRPSEPHFQKAPNLTTHPHGCNSAKREGDEGPQRAGRGETVRICVAGLRDV